MDLLEELAVEMDQIYVEILKNATGINDLNFDLGKNYKELHDEDSRQITQKTYQVIYLSEQKF